MTLPITIPSTSPVPVTIPTPVRPPVALPIPVTLPVPFSTPTPLPFALLQFGAAGCCASPASVSLSGPCSSLPAESTLRDAIAPQPPTQPAQTPAPTELAIEAEGLTRIYGRGQAAVRAVDGVQLRVRAGEVVLVFGPSGCGKSTLLGLLGGLDRDYTGSLRLFGTDTSSLSDRELSRLRGERIGFVFQAFHLLDHLDVLCNVTAPSLFAATYQPQQVRERGLEVLERVKLADRAPASPASLSGGQRQRVAIARAILHRPALLFCDEPTGNLDRDTGAQIIELFAALHQDLRTTIVIVTHEDRMGALEHRKLHMVDGRFLAEGAEP